MATQVDSRRLTGPNLVLAGAGATIDVDCTDDEREPLVRRWTEHARAMLDAVGWSDCGVASRPVPTGVSLAFDAPIDALYAACEIAEWAWERATSNDETHDNAAFEAARERFVDTILEERNPAVLALRDAAEERGVPFLWDDDEVSVGSGQRSKTWPARECPDPKDVPWSELGAIPIALVTGTNGKTTTVRLLAQIARAAGLCPGFSSTDGIWAGEEIVVTGDYSGPGGARAVLRESKVDYAILETARGGLQRRGVGVEAADVACVLNVSADHLGEFGVATVDDLTAIKFLITKVVPPTGRVILNGDDPRVGGRRGEFAAEVALFSLDPHSSAIEEWRREKRPCAFLDGETLVLDRGGAPEAIIDAKEMPIAFGGAARHNLANALAAILIADATGIPTAAIRDGLSSFRPTPESLPGRTNLFEFDDVRVLVDFAHNPDGHAALLDLAAQMPAKRRCVILGQAGDRDNDSIVEMSRATVSARPDRVFIKEMPRYLRGREAGNVPKLIQSVFDELSFTEYEHHDTELDAVRAALEWARPGDLLLFPIHESRADVVEILEGRVRGGAHPTGPGD